MFFRKAVNIINEIEESIRLTVKPLLLLVLVAIFRIHHTFVNLTDFCNNKVKKYDTHNKLIGEPNQVENGNYDKD